jgi:pilus assembly protein CpaB
MNPDHFGIAIARSDRTAKQAGQPDQAGLSMNRRLLTILLLAFVVAGVCAFMVYRMVGSRMSASRPVNTTRVVAAAADIKLGTVLTAANLSTVEIAGPVPKGAILKPEDAINRGVVSDLYQGEPILESRLAAKGSGGGLAATIPPGMRASAVKVDEVVGVAGFVTPGMRVDVLVAGTPPGEPNATEGTHVVTLLQNIQVLSAGTDIQKDAEGKPVSVQVVNLLVTPEDAEKLNLATSQQNRIQLVLRNPLDNSVTPVASNAMENLFADKNMVKPKVAPVKTAPKPAAPKPFSIEIINGSKRSEEKFGTPEDKK